MAEIGHPLVGEGKYSSMKNDLGFRFQALCAWSLTFRFEGDSAPLDYLNRTAPSPWERTPLPAISGTGSDAAMQIHRITARQALNHVGGDPYDYDLNIYRGCAHRCRYCFAIYSQEFLKPQAGETNFFEDIFIKENIVELLERRLASPHWTGAVINIGGVTDSYQPVEAREKRMPEILRLMIRYRNPITISTKSVLMLRDLDLFDELSRLTYVGIASTVTTLDEPVRRVIEPGARPFPGPAGDAPGICPAHPAVVGVHSMPVIPLITDSTENLTGLIEATREIGADYWLPGTLNLRGLTRGMFFDCVRQNFPDAEAGLARLYASGHLDPGIPPDAL